MSDNTLKKELKLTNLISMAAGGMIAAWMVEIKFWFELSGPGAVVSLITCALLVLPLCLIYSELTRTLPYAGGENIWVSNAFGWNAGWFSCWGVMLLYIMAMPTVAYGIASMVGFLYPITFFQTKLIAAIILIIWFFLTNKELKILAKMQSIMFWSTLVVSITASIIFMTNHQWSYDNLTPWFPNGFAGYGAAVGLLIMKFVGFDLIPQLSEESNFPKKKLWIAFVGSLFLTVLIYGLAVIGVGGIVSTEWVAETDIVDPRVADIIGMHWLGVIIVVMGSLTCLTTLSSFWLCASRTLYGAAKQRQFTPMFTALNKEGQPWKANIVVGILSMYFTVFAPEAWINHIYTIYGAAAGVVYLLVTLSFLKLRKTKPNWERPYKVKAATVMGIISIIFTLWVIYSSVIAMDMGAWIVLGLYLLLGIPFWAYAKNKQKTDPEKWGAVILSPDNQK
ncbi:APC family permease [Anaerovorax sp. IOR16]|uniref:APC family permease n=1 Tax=Anaerovorax sp. IOR16 TaxID=2773458 RepID=UPI0019D247F4|nr:APC family permease [Anaerovorax sp. IOR16]